MTRGRWSNHRVMQRRRRPPASTRERKATRRQLRARAHLERVRGAPRSGLPLAPFAGAAAVVSLLLGALLGDPWVAVARGWIAGEPVRLEAVSIRGAGRVPLESIAAATGLEPGAPLAEIDVRSVERNLSDHPWIASARALRLPTGRLLVSVTEQVARAVVTGGDESFAVDAAGTPFARAEARDLATLPRLTPSDEVRVDQIDETLASAIALAYRLPEFDLPVPLELFIATASDPTGFSLRLPDLQPRVVLGRSDFDSRLAALARLLAAGLPELTGSEALDLRFADQAVLRGAPTPQESSQAAAARGRAASSIARPAG